MATLRSGVLAEDKEITRNNASAEATEVGYRNAPHHERRMPLPGGFAVADAGSLHPGLWKPFDHRKLANPAPLGLSGFALTTFVLSAINMHTRGVVAPNIIVSLAFSYGGLTQLLAGMWEMAAGNTFGATALSSYGGFWISFAIILIPDFKFFAEDGPYGGDVNSVLGFFMMGWFIFSFFLLLCTLRSTVMFFLLFFSLDITLLLLAGQYFAADNGAISVSIRLQKAGGLFGFLTSFLAWYNALAGIQDASNSFFQLPVFHFPWSDMGKELRKQHTEHTMV